MRKPSENQDTKFTSNLIGHHSHWLLYPSTNSDLGVIKGYFLFQSKHNNQLDKKYSKAPVNLTRSFHIVSEASSLVNRIMLKPSFALIKLYENLQISDGSTPHSGVQ